MNAPARIDFTKVPTIDVARELLGEESRERSTAKEKHFPGNSGLFVNVQKNLWYSHGNSAGGDAAGLVKFVTGCDFANALSWLNAHDYTNGATTPAPRLASQIVAEYDYRDEEGDLLFQVVRFEPKDFRQRRPDCNGGWDWKLNGVRRVPYRLPELFRAMKAGKTIYIAEGEKGVDKLIAAGVAATCSAMGAGKWRDEYSTFLGGADVVILPDADEPGEAHCAAVAESLTGVAGRVRVLRLAGLPDGGDVYDWLEAGGNAEQLTQAADLVDVWRVVVTSRDAWSDPVALPDGLAHVAAFDPELMPESISPWISDISERMQCPPDYVGMTALVGLGSVLGRKIGIAPEQQTDWFEVPNLWACCVGRPGVMKTPAIGEALKPLHRLEVKAREKYDAEAKEYAKTLQLWKMRKDAAESTFKTALKKDPGVALTFSDLEPTAPIECRYVTNDTTYEKLGEILAQNPNGVLAHRDELVSLLKTLDREEYAAARGFFLTAWNGKERYTFDRIGRGRVHIDGACLSMIGSTQPGRLAEYVRRAISGGAGDDGLIQRFGLLVWPDQPPGWESVDRYPDIRAREAAWGVFDSFDRLDPGAIGAEPTSIYQSVPVLRLDKEAHGLFLEWRQDLERRLRSPDGLHPALESHFAKYRKLVPALALINHLADVGHGQIGKAAMLRALSLAEYLETHAERAYGAGAEAETAAAKAILSHIRKDDLTDCFTLRDVCRQQWSNLTDRDQAQAGLHLLCDLDWLAAEERKPHSAGRPTVQYHINPGAKR